ncbi:MAG: ribonuclease P protein component [Oscillospiraceae bacterium]
MKDFVSLNQNSQFKKLYKRGKSCVKPSLVIYAIHNREGLNRFGITTSKKIGNAVIRNRAKRRIRELYRMNVQNFKPGFDVCVVARVRTATEKHEVLVKDFESACRNLGLYKI